MRAVLYPVFICARSKCSVARRFVAALIRSVLELGRQNVSRLFGRALFNGGGIVRFDWGNRLRQLGIGLRFCGAR